MRRQLVALKPLTFAHHRLSATLSQLSQLHGVEGNVQVKPKSLRSKSKPHTSHIINEQSGKEEIREVTWTARG